MEGRGVRIRRIRPDGEGRRGSRIDSEEGGRYLGIPETGWSSRLTSVQGTGCGTGRCNLLGHRSQIEDTDVDAVINAFKRAYCENCPKREPFERT